MQNRATLFESIIQATAEPEFEVSDIRGSHQVISLIETPDAAVIFNQMPTEKQIQEFNRWLRHHRDDYVRLYHGTSSKVPVMDKGLLPTTKTRRRSYQSESGYVYLSLYPSSARTFGELGYPYDDVVVYAVDIRIRELRPDTDQLRNKRMYFDSEIGETLADSLIFGHGARVKRVIQPYEIKKTNY